MTDWEKLKSTDASINDDNFDYLMNRNNMFKRSEIDLYNNIYRFGRLDPYNAVTNTKEYLFFTKPDLNIVTESGKLNDYLADQPFFKELYRKYPLVIQQLQSSADKRNNPLCLLLSNSAISSLDVPQLSAESIDTASNIYGTSYDYRGSSEASNDNFDFSIEFRDTRYLDVYHYFKAYDTYEMLKHHGLVAPKKKYITNKILHDQIGIYKFLVDEDYQTIIYYAYYWGVMFKSLPRDVFSSPTFDNGISYSIDMKAAFVDDMDPLIIRDFNSLTKNYRSNMRDIPIYDEEYDSISGKIVKCPYIETRINTYGKEVYTLKWKG